MIVTKLQMDFKARGSKERILAFSFFLSILAHGLFFPREWTVIGLVLASGYLWTVLKNAYEKRHWGNKPFLSNLVLSQIVLLTDGTDVFFLVMVGLSLLGLLHPVKIAAGLSEGMHWLTLWLVFRWSREISFDTRMKTRMLKFIRWSAVFWAVSGWLLRMSENSQSFLEAGRLSSWSGNADVAAAFLGAIILLGAMPKLMKVFLILSFLATGSRGAIGLFLIVSVLKYILELGLFRQQPGKQFIKEVKRLSGKGLGQNLGFLGLVLVGLGITWASFRPAWQHLMSWGFASASWGERLLFYQDGLKLAMQAKGLPQAGGWLAYPLVQQLPYSTIDPHSSFIHILLNQGIAGVLAVVLWILIELRRFWPMIRRENAGASWNGQGRNALNVNTPNRKDPSALNTFMALTFLALHSLFDVDLLFGSLGFLFWILLGLYGDREPAVKVEHYPVRRLMRTSIVCLFFLLNLALLTVNLGLLLNSNVIDQENAWAIQAQKLEKQDPRTSIIDLEKSLAWDQSEVLWRQRLAELEMEKGNEEKGLNQVEAILRWQRFNLPAYEWAQGIVWQEAERERLQRTERAKVFYQWVADVPRRIEAVAQSVPDSKQYLWQEYPRFKPSPHITLLAKYAGQRLHSLSSLNIR